MTAAPGVPGDRPGDASRFLIELQDIRKSHGGKGAREGAAATTVLHGISLQIQQVSEDVLQINQGSLYPALHRLEQQGLIEAEWGNSENNRQAKYYQLTKSGRKQLAEEMRNWERLADAVGRILAH